MAENDAPYPAHLGKQEGLAEPQSSLELGHSRLPLALWQTEGIKAVALVFIELVSVTPLLGLSTLNNIH